MHILTPEIEESNLTITTNKLSYKLKLFDIYFQFFFFFFAFLSSFQNRLFTVLYFPLKSQMLIVEFQGQLYWSLYGAKLGRVQNASK